MSHLSKSTKSNTCMRILTVLISTNVPVDMQIFLVYSIDCDIKYKADILGSPSQSSWWRQGNQQWHWVWDSLWAGPHVWHKQEHWDSLLQSHHRQGEWLCHLWNIYTRYTILFIVLSEHFVKSITMPGLSATEVDRDGVRGRAVTTEVTIIVSVSLAFYTFLATQK